MGLSREEINDLVLGVDKMVWKLAWTSWHTLPPALRVWVEPADLHQEGLIALWERAHRWDPQRGAFTTFAHITVRNVLVSFFQRWTALKRYAGVLADLETLELKMPDGWRYDPPVTDAVLESWFLGSGDAVLDSWQVSSPRTPVGM